MATNQQATFFNLADQPKANTPKCILNKSSDAA